MKVSRSSVEAANKVKKQGVPQLVDALAAGKVAVSAAARIAEQQQVVVAGIQSGLKPKQARPSAGPVRQRPGRLGERRGPAFSRRSPPRLPAARGTADSVPAGAQSPLLQMETLLTGIHLMQTCVVEANLLRLNETANLPYLDDLIQRKVGGAEKERLTETDLGFHRSEYDRLRDKLQQAYEASGLPEAPRGSAALHDLFVRLRLSESMQ